MKGFGHEIYPKKNPPDISPPREGATSGLEWCVLLFLVLLAGYRNIRMIRATTAIGLLSPEVLFIQQDTVGIVNPHWG